MKDIVMINVTKQQDDMINSTYFYIFLSNMTQRSLFSINRTKYFSKPQAFAKVTYHGFFKCEGKCYPNT